MSVANMEAYAMAQGIDKAYSSMTQAEQATLRYNYLLSVSADAQGDFARTASTSFANASRITELNIQNIGAAIGKELIPAATRAQKAVGGFAADLAEAMNSGGIRGGVGVHQDRISRGDGGSERPCGGVWVVCHYQDRSFVC